METLIVNVDVIKECEKTLRKESLRKWNLACKRTNPKYKKANERLMEKADYNMMLANYLRLVLEYVKE